jgi:NAD(P)-dependent dehydrogenase (short-subunit alcohol dehydrogenase family)
MQPVVLVTGASSGIGRATAMCFAARGWRVAATLRSPEKETELGRLPGVTCFRLDVDSETSVRDAVAEVLSALGRIDAVVNNAGFGAPGVFEATDDPSIRRQFETNVFGLMRVTREVLPILRRQGGGTLLQVSSMAGRSAFPGYSLYHASKWAVEGFSESLAYELRPLNIRVRLIEPGNVKTGFYRRTPPITPSPVLSEYGDLPRRLEEISDAAGQAGDPPELIAETIHRAAVDRSWRLRYPVGRNARLAMLLHNFLPTGAYARFMSRRFRV